jgi:GxxExxY protein
MLKRRSCAEGDFDAIPSASAPALLAESLPEVADAVARIKENYRTFSSIRCAAISVWRTLGAGHCESIYRTALAVHLISCGYKVQEEVPVAVYYDDACVGVGRADLVVSRDGSKTVIELKTVAKLNDSHKAQARAYMRGLDLSSGTLINFPPSGDGAEAEVEAVPC